MINCCWSSKFCRHWSTLGEDRSAFRRPSRFSKVLNIQKVQLQGATKIWKRKKPLSTASYCPALTIKLSPQNNAAAAAAKSLQSCPTLCNPIDRSPPGSPVPGILQARTLEWVAISFSNAWKWKVKVKSLSRVQLLATPWTAAHQAPPSMGFSRQEYWSGVTLPSPFPKIVLHILKWRKKT